MAISIKVRYEKSEPLPHLQSYELRVTVLEATEMPTEVFVFQQRIAPAYTKDVEPEGRFICLADPVDLEELPINTPDLAKEIPYYRTDNVTLRFRSYVELEDTLSLLQTDIQSLVTSLKIEAVLAPSEDVTYV